MKQVHNIRIRVTDRNKESIKEILDIILRDGAIERKDIELLITSDQDPQDPIYIGELWMDHQPPVRKIIKLLNEKLSVEDKASFSNRAMRALDTATHCFIKLDKTEFLEGKYVLGGPENVVHVRLNIAAFPATKENAAKVVEQLFAQIP